MIAGLALMSAALMITVFLGSRYLLELDKVNNDVPIANLTGLGEDKILKLMSGKVIG